ncbi:hypothetical protein [Haemophilus parahaemolyticus]|uniref:hypothetical protein n=1 Tax=Haemophilus parahaemolyticus TaxID=735 RepID=UPI0028E5B063|nr:hypothetical protein [Haemophilus parahaemolyticus]
MNTTSVHFPEAVQKALDFASITEPNPPMLEEEDELEMIPYYEIYASAGYGSFNLSTRRLYWLKS